MEILQKKHCVDFKALICGRIENHLFFYFSNSLDVDIRRTKPFSVFVNVVESIHMIWFFYLLSLTITLLAFKRILF